MAAKHTPGPWLYAHREGDDGMFNTQVFSPDNSLGVIATCAWVPHRLGNGVTGTYREANARLIAAAPDLLDALQWLVALLPDPELDSNLVQRREVIKAKAAIAKATGKAQ